MLDVEITYDFGLRIETGTERPLVLCMTLRYHIIGVCLSSFARRPATASVAAGL